MSAKIANLKEVDDILTFTLSGVDVSYANAIRRTILSDIPIVCFKTTPNEENKAYLDEGDLRKIFPSYVPPTGKGEYFVDFVKLRPKLSEELPGERIKLTCALTLGTARQDSSFNVTGTCAYGCTPDESKIVEELAKRKQKWADEGKTEANIAFESANWKLLEGLRYVKRRSFDYILQTVGIYENSEIIVKSCQILMDKFVELKQMLDKDKIEIQPSDSTMETSYDVILENEDYTVGNILNFELYDTYYRDLKKLTYVGFKKMHPHDSHSILRVGFVEPTAGKDTVRQLLAAVFETAFKELSHIKGLFDGGRK